MGGVTTSSGSMNIRHYVLEMVFYETEFPEMSGIKNKATHTSLLDHSIVPKILWPKKKERKEE